MECAACTRAIERICSRHTARQTSSASARAWYDGRAVCRCGEAASKTKPTAHDRTRRLAQPPIDRPSVPRLFFVSFHEARAPSALVTCAIVPMSHDSLQLSLREPIYTCTIQQENHIQMCSKIVNDKKRRSIDDRANQLYIQPGILHLHCLNRHTVFYFSFSSEITVTFGCPTVLLVPFYFVFFYKHVWLCRVHLFTFLVYVKKPCKDKKNMSDLCKVFI